MSENIYIIGVGMIKFGKYLNKSVKDLTGEALREVVRDADVSKDDIEAAWFSNSQWGMYAFQHCIRGQVALSAHGLDRVSIVNVENACASDSTALHSAWTAIKAGLAMTHELTTQLRGEGGKRQVENGRIALAENGGGTLGAGEASVAIHIFEKAR